MTAIRSVALGCGSYLPQKVLTNAELAARVDTSDEWIVQRTGIRQRHIAAEGEFTSHLAINAARAALADAGVDAQSIDLIVLATSTPDYTFPATAVAVQNGLGINHGAAFDLQAVCSGFIFALATADNFLRTGAFKRALVIGAETFSRILDWNDRGTCVLFGDGAGAIVLEAEPQPGKSSDRGILTTHLRSDGRHRSKLYVDGGPSSTRTVGYLRMEGREVFKHAVGMITDVIVTEGFSGNIALKAAEGTARQINDFLRAALSRTWRSKLGYLLARGAFKELRDKLDPNKSNGGVLLGLNGVVVKSHGGISAEGFAYAVDVGYEMVHYDLLTKINQMLDGGGSALAQAPNAQEAVS